MHTEKYILRREQIKNWALRDSSLNVYEFKTGNETNFPDKGSTCKEEEDTKDHWSLKDPSEKEKGNECIANGVNDLQHLGSHRLRCYSRIPTTYAPIFYLKTILERTVLQSWSTERAHSEVQLILPIHNPSKNISHL